MQAIVSFIDNNDRVCVIGEMLGGFRPNHTALQYGELYLYPPRKGGCRWMAYCAYRSTQVHAFRIQPKPHHPLDLFEATVGKTVQPPIKLMWSTLLYEMGIPIQLSNCVTIISSALNIMGIPTKGQTPHRLYLELMEMSTNPLSGVTYEPPNQPKLNNPTDLS